MILRIGGLIAFVGVAFACVGFAPASALDAIQVDPKAPVTNVSKSVELHKTDSNRLQVSAAPGRDGIVRRLEIRARDSQGPTHWLVFALTNNTDDAIDFRLVVPYGDGKPRVVMLTPSQGTRPALEKTKVSDVYPLRLDPGFTITYIAELASDSIPELTLWEESAYRKQGPG